MAKRILLVDDDVDYVLQLSTRLKAEGYDVTTADSVAAAKEEVARQQPDLAVLDLMMENPDDGFRLCYHIKKVNKSIPIILVTAVASETGLDFDATTKEERSWIKADVVLDKPILFEQLKGEIHRLLHA